MSTFRPMASLALAGALLMPSYALADDYDDYTTTDTVEVTVGKRVQDIMDSPYAVEVITAEEIARTAAVTFTDIFKNLPGISVDNYGNISIRGSATGMGSSSTVVIFVDGVRLTPISSSGNSDTLIMPDNIERVEIIKGPASALYGSGAFGGVINVITKKGGTEPLQGSFKTAYSSKDESFIESGSVYGKIDDFSYRLNLSYTNENGLKSYHDTIPYAQAEMFDIDTWVGYDITDKINLALGYEYYNSREDMGTDLYPNLDERENTNRVYTTLKMQDLFSFMPLLQINGAYYRNERERDYVPVDISTLNNYSFDIQADWLIGDNGYLITGYEFYTEDWTSKASSTAVENSGQKTHRDSVDSSHALFASLDYALPYDFTLTLGARYEYYSAEGSAYVYNASTGAIQADEGKNSGSDSAPTFNVGLVWQGIEDLALRALYAQGFRSPTAYQKYQTTSMNGMFLILGNPDLKPEYSDNFEIGARYDDGRLSYDVSAFYIMQKDKISSESYGDEIVYSYMGYNFTNYAWQNIAKSESWGLEFMLAYDDFLGVKGLEPYVSGTWMQRKDQYDGVWEMYEQLPNFTSRVGARYVHEFGNGILFNSDFYVWYESATETSDGDKISDLMTLNLSLGATWGDQKQYFGQLDLLNILDSKDYYRYATYASTTYYNPGFNVNLVLGMRF